MLNIWTENGKIMLAGRFDHSQGSLAEKFFIQIEDSRVLDFGQLEYISSAGIGVLLATQKRLHTLNQNLKIVNPNNHVRDVFRYAGLTQIFHIE